MTKWESYGRWIVGIGALVLSTVAILLGTWQASQIIKAISMSFGVTQSSVSSLKVSLKEINDRIEENAFLMARGSRATEYMWTAYLKRNQWEAHEEKCVKLTGIGYVSTPRGEELLPRETQEKIRHVVVNNKDKLLEDAVAIAIEEELNINRLSKEKGVPLMVMIGTIAGFARKMRAESD